MVPFDEAIEQERAYTALDYKAITGAGTHTIMLITPTQRIGVTLYLDVYADEEVTVELYEAATHNAGTGITPWNRDRVSAATASTTVSHTVSGGTNGTLLLKHTINDTGNVQGAVGGAAFRGQAIRLKAHRKYLIKHTAGADNVNVSTFINFVEEVRDLMTTTTTSTTSTTSTTTSTSTTSSSSSSSSTTSSSSSSSSTVSSSSSSSSSTTTTAP